MVELDNNKVYSYQEFATIFSSEEVCKNYLSWIRWDGVPVCPFCNSDDICQLDGVCKDLNCRNCRKRFTPILKTIFQNTKIPLSKWFFLIYSSALNNKNISSVQMSKNLGLTQSTCWHIMMKIKCLYEDTEIQKLSGIVEVDECFLCTGTRWTRWNGLSKRKEPILGLKQREGRLIIKMIETRSQRILEEIIREHVEEGSIIYTDGFLSYRNLQNWYNHEWLDHSSHEYVRADNPEIHTNNIENVWMQLKKSIRGANHSISRQHVKRYCDEVSYRINYKHLTVVQRFHDILLRAVDYGVRKKFRKHEKGTTNILQ